MRFICKKYSNTSLPAFSHSCTVHRSNLLPSKSGYLLSYNLSILSCDCYTCMQPYDLLMQVLLLLVSLAFHEVFITSKSFLKAVAGGASLHFLSNSPFSEMVLYRIELLIHTVACRSMFFVTHVWCHQEF